MPFERTARWGLSRAGSHLGDLSEGVPRRPIGRYVVGLALIGLLAIASTMLTSVNLDRQADDTSLLGTASGQITRADDLVSAIGVMTESEASEAQIAGLEVMVADLEEVQRSLRFGDDGLGLAPAMPDDIASLLVVVEGQLATLLGSVEEILVSASRGEPIAEAALADLAAQADLYETGMNSAVFAVQAASESRVASLQASQFAMLSIILVVLVLEGLFLFRPAVVELQREWLQQEERHRNARRDDQKKLSYLARYDPLTGLINRFLFGDRLQGAIARARRDQGLVALMFLDLDEFKAVNDRFGHAVGDGLLKQVGQRLVNSVRESDTVARLGGDEFTVVLEGNQRVEDAGHVATKILRALEVPYHVDGHELRVTASIGIALYPVDGDNAEALLRDADIAMYSAKAAGRDTYQYFTPELREQTSQRLQVIDELRLALAADGQLELVYQPKVDAVAGMIIGAEALVRWNHPNMGKVYPANFVPLAEETDLIIPLGEWVLHEACRQMKWWLGEGIADITVSVNVSSRQLRRGNLVDTVTAALEASGLDPVHLEIELTEGTLIEDTELAHRTLERLREMGVRIAVDDFGTGYSSLSYLQRFSIDALKIDRIFVSDIMASEDAAALSAAIIGLANSLRLDVIAEGVETTEQLRRLVDLGCTKMQGYLISRPLPPDGFADFYSGGLDDIFADFPRPVAG